MSLAPGTRLGRFEILAAIGAGGMGEVYRARDTSLDRDVAVKTLPELFAIDADRVTRFEREAKTLALLNHPNIAQIHGVEQAGRTHALVMELVDGEDLAQRLARGPLPIDDAIDVARQVAEALEAAHELGIVHRDLKPGNIKVRADGVVKVLDFGLAKALDAGASGSSGPMQNSPTFTSPATQLGVILGTAAYMAPEQAKGKTVDRRADIWAFGVVLHEMLTGRNLWSGDTATETIAHVITREADLTSLPAGTPAVVRSLIARCLIKDPKVRLRDIGEARVALAGIEAGTPEQHAALPVRAQASSRAAWMVAGAMAIAAAAFAGVWLLAPKERPAVIRASIDPPPGRTFGGVLALSPDGTRIVFDAIGPDDLHSQLWLQDLATGTRSPIRHTEDAQAPFWSPDGREIGFFAGDKLKRIDLQGGPPQAIADANTPRGAAWTPDGRIVFTPSFRAGLSIVDAHGGTPAAVTKLEGHDTSHRWPVIAPDGRHVIFLAQTSEGGTHADTSAIEVVGLDGAGRRKLVVTNSSPLYAAPGFLMFWRQGALLAQRLDPGSLQLSGDPFVVAQEVAYSQSEQALASVSTLGRLVFAAGAPAGRSTLTVLDRAGRTVKTLGPAAGFDCGMALSPDGTRLVFGRTAEGANACDLWAIDLVRGGETRLTFDDRNEYAPVFAPDGRSFLYGGDTAKEALYELDFDRRGPAKVVFATNTESSPDSPGAIARDRSWVLMSAVFGKTGRDIVRYDVASGKFTPIVQTPFTETDPVLSPDERWVAYTSDRSGRREVYVEPVIGGGSPFSVSTAGGEVARWRSDGKELFFLAPPDRLMSVTVGVGAGLQMSAPKELFRAPYSFIPGYAVAPDGQQFIVGVQENAGQRQLLTIVSDWRPR